MSEDLYSSNFRDFYDASLEPIELLSEERYINKVLIDEGAIKKIYKVTDTHCSREVALAEIKDDIFSEGQALDFVREVQLTASLQHPNIIRIYNIGFEGSSPWFTMEYMPSKNLAHFIAENSKISLIKRLEIFLQISNAISYAHENDILHLDLKPSNISMSERAQPIICDWGISSSVASSPDDDLLRGQTLNGYIKGSPDYMAPEQIQPDYQKHKSADIYGLGGLLYFILSGRNPLEEFSNDELLEQAEKGSLQSLKLDEVPNRLKPILEKSLALQAEKRYASADDMALDIEQYLNGFATAAEKASLTIQLRLFVKRHLLLTCSFLFFIIALLGMTWHYLNKINLKNTELIAQTEEAERQKLKAGSEKAKAEQAAMQAEKALLDYQKEQEANEAAQKYISALLLNQNLYNLYLFNFDAALNAALETHKKNPNWRTHWRVGFTYFVLQEYEKALPYLETMAIKNYKELYHISKKYQNKKKPLSLRDQKQLYDLTPRSLRNIHTFLVYFSAQNNPVETHVHLLMHAIAKQNRLRTIKYSYDAKTQTLDLSGNGNIRWKVIVYVGDKSVGFNRYVNLLSTLPMKKIIMDKTKFNQEETHKFLPSKSIELSYK